MDKGKLYLAARYSRRDEMRKVAAHLHTEGFSVTSRWLFEDKPLNTKLGDDSVLFYADTAQIDIDDIDRADTIMFFSEDPHVGTPRGGRHVEYGYALGTGKRLVVIGGAENIFHYLPAVLHFPNVQSFIESEES
jgi:hypothetical protein